MYYDQHFTVKETKRLRLHNWLKVRGPEVKELSNINPGSLIPEHVLLTSMLYCPCLSTTLWWTAWLDIWLDSSTKLVESRYECLRPTVDGHTEIKERKGQEEQRRTSEQNAQEDRVKNATQRKRKITNCPSFS